MISRKKILSKSRDLLNSSDLYDQRDGVWFKSEHLFNDQIDEVVKKYNQLDDEIWAKLIVMEKNQRIAKAYARSSSITINGSDAGFDGVHIGMNGFQSPSNDPTINQIKGSIGKGVKIRMDDSGNILIKKLTRTHIIVKGTSSGSDGADCESSLSKEVLQAGGRLEADKWVKMFDTNKFTMNLEREMTSSYPDRRKLQHQAILIVSFTKDASNILDLPVYVILINIVAIDLLRTRFGHRIHHPQPALSLPRPPPMESDYTQLKGNQHSSCSTASSSDPFIPTPIPAPRKLAPFKLRPFSSHLSSSVSNLHPLRLVPYSIPSMPPSLPPRELPRLPTPDYDTLMTSSSSSSSIPQLNPFKSNGRPPPSQFFPKSGTFNRKISYNHSDDPYYFGMEAKVSNFNMNPDFKPKMPEPKGHGTLKGGSILKNPFRPKFSVFSLNPFNSNGTGTIKESPAKASPFWRKSQSIGHLNHLSDLDMSRPLNINGTTLYPAYPPYAYGIHHPIRMD